VNVQQAFDTLEIPNGSSKEEAKKAFKKLAAKLHPDNKETGDENAFKKLNEAYQIVESGQPTDTDVRCNWAAGPSYWGPFQTDTVNLQDLIDGIHGQGRPRRKHFNASDIRLEQTISFREAVLGCTKEITYTHDVCCSTCGGAGEKSIPNGCSTCGGTGRFIRQAGMTIVNQTCPACRGKVSYQTCDACSGVGTLNITTSVSVNIPPGIQNGTILGLGNRGNYAGQMMGMEQYSKVLLVMQVIPQDGLSLEGDTVISAISISLLEALQGTVKTVPTIDGDKEAIIPEGTRHQERVILPNLGVSRRGDQAVLVNVRYPDNTSSLISFLKGDQ
jgi:molecular chaperone DnaJ